MLIGDILHSCANEGVAEAAVASIGGDFAERVGRAAERCDLGVGALTVTLVRRFASEATERDWRLVTAVIGGSELPVLAGLRAIVERMMVRHVLEQARDGKEAGSVAPAWHNQPGAQAAACAFAC